ncbi:type II pantothenate kinase [Bacillus carboniphilus]|uniref:Type II pantothenate kinase n=1 Tax=Bacillus carboniphilus TaxID=86663 RepID=A0ABP3GGW8_9BACI
MKSIGIDAGGSLLKLAYLENNRYHYKQFPIQDLDQAVSWVQLTAPQATFKVTGGKASIVQQKLTGADVKIVPEFDAVCLGTKEMIIHEKHYFHDFMIVSMGTGTSFYLMKENQYERLFGSGIGGGTLLGLGQLLLATRDFQQIVELAKKGERNSVDLLVKDLYEGEEPPIPGHLTAANFGKPDLSQSPVEDVAAALFQMIGETMVLLGKQFAAPHQVQKFVYVGGTISHNPPLQKVINSFDSMLQHESIFLQNGTFAGAVGALVY